MADGTRAPDEEEDEGDDGPELPPPWGPTTRIVAAVLWPSFLCSCVATMLCFALVDPELLYHATTPPLDISRETGYGVGFFFFWAVTTLSSTLTILLLRGRSDPQGRGPQP